MRRRRPASLFAGVYAGDGPQTGLPRVPTGRGSGQRLETIAGRPGRSTWPRASCAKKGRSQPFGSRPSHGRARWRCSPGAPRSPPHRRPHKRLGRHRGRPRSPAAAGVSSASAATTRRRRPRVQRSRGARRLVSSGCFASTGRRGRAAGRLRTSSSKATRSSSARFVLRSSTSWPRSPIAARPAVGARGLSGPAYSGHVFWDSDVFVLPFLAATHPEAARAMLEYRVRRLPAARDAARALGRAGARFAWESAADGRDVTPASARLATGELVRIRTGELEEHIVGDVAWAAACYLDWTGDEDFATGPGGELFVETARYWASRVRYDRERPGAHLWRDRPGRVPRARRRQRIHERPRPLEPPAGSGTRRRRRARARVVARDRRRARRRLRPRKRHLRAVRRLLRPRAAGHRGDRSATADRRRRPPRRGADSPARRC